MKSQTQSIVYICTCSHNNDFGNQFCVLIIFSTSIIMLIKSTIHYALID